MKPIQYCPKNDKLGTRQVHADIARDFPDVRQQRKGCLKECKICRRQPFVKVGKKLICADTPEQLYEQLTLLIRKQDDKPKKAETSDKKKLKKKKQAKQQEDESNTKKDKKLKKQQKAAKKAAAKSKEKSKSSKVLDTSNPNKKRRSADRVIVMDKTVL